MGEKPWVSCVRKTEGGWYAGEEQGEQRLLFLGLASLLYLGVGVPWERWEQQEGR